jgi:hypothetical protein
MGPSGTRPLTSAGALEDFGRWLDRVWQVPEGPAAQLRQNREELFAHRREVVFVAYRPLLVWALPHDADFLQSSEAVGEEVRRESFGRLQEVSEAMCPGEKEIPDHEERPAVAQDVECARDRTGGPEVEARSSSSRHDRKVT